MDAAILNAIADMNPSSSGWFRANCPFCEQRVGKVDRQRCLAVNVRTGRYMCWRCEVRGSVPVEVLSHQDRAVTVVDHGHRYLGKPEGFYRLGGRPPLSLRRAALYLDKRRVPRSAVRELGIGAAVSGYLSHRVVVPVKGYGSRWLGWVARSYSGAEPRYLYPPGMRRGELLFNEARLTWDTDSPALLVEGVMDALPHWPHAVACLGKPSRWQKERLRSADCPIAVALDSDAQDEGWALAMELRLYGRRAGFVKLPPGKDPGDMTDTGRLLEAAVRSIYEEV